VKLGLCPTHATCLPLDEKLHLNNKLGFVGNQMGLTTINQHALSLDDLVEKADQALYVGKENGRDQYVIN
jgi:PleD family two-component response regulator